MVDLLFRFRVSKEYRWGFVKPECLGFRIRFRHGLQWLVIGGSKWIAKGTGEC